MNSTNATKVAAETNDFGVSRVSGYYGPGSILAWLLLSLSCLLATPGPHKPAIQVRWTWKHLLRKTAINLDVDLLSVFAFPFIASVQALWIHGSYNDGTRDDMALLAAPLIVVSYGKVVFALLVARFSGGVLRPRGIFALVSLMYFSIISTSLDLRCCGASWEVYSLPIPQHVHREDQQAGLCYQNLKQFYALKSPAAAVGTDLFYGHSGGSIVILKMGTMVAATALYSAAFFAQLFWDLFLVTWTEDYQRGFWRIPWTTGSLRIRFRTSRDQGGPPAQFLLFFYSSAVNSILILLMVRDRMPPTTASIRDLDQMAAVVVGGVLPLMKDLVPSILHYLTQRNPSRSQPGTMPAHEPPPKPPLNLPSIPPRNSRAKASRKKVRTTDIQTINEYIEDEQKTLV